MYKLCTNDSEHKTALQFLPKDVSLPWHCFLPPPPFPGLFSLCFFRCVSLVGMSMHTCTWTQSTFHIFLIEFMWRMTVEAEVSEEKTGFGFDVSKIFLSYLYLCVHVWVWAHDCRYPRRPKAQDPWSWSTCGPWLLSHLSGFCFYFLRETGSDVTQANLKLSIQLMMTLNWSFCLYPWGAGVIATCHHIQLEKQF